jgi:hypothetical protein
LSELRRSWGATEGPTHITAGPLASEKSQLFLLLDIMRIRRRANLAGRRLTRGRRVRNHTSWKSFIRVFAIPSFTIASNFSAMTQEQQIEIVSSLAGHVLQTRLHGRGDVFWSVHVSISR